MQPLREIFHYTAGLKRLMIIIAVSSIIGAGLSFVQPLIIKAATDWIVKVINHTAQFDVGMVVLLAGLAVATAVIGAIINDIGGYFGDQLSIRARYQLSSRYFEHLLKLPQSYYDNEVTGKIINRLSRAISDITNFLQFFSNNLLQMLLTIGITIAILVVYSWPLALLFALLIPANLYLTARTSKPWQAIEKEKNTHFDIASGRFAEAVGQMRLIKSFNTASTELASFRREVGKMVPLTAKQSRGWHKMNAMRSTIFGLINGLIFAVLFYETARGKFSLGDMTMLLTLIAQVSFPMRNLSFFVDGYQRAVANSRDFIAAMHEDPEPSDAGKRALQVGDGKVEFRDVSFSYDADDKTVLSNVSFVIDAGKKLALVGESGGGKTTISNLLMDIYQPLSGSILIDRQELEKVSRKSIREAIATVFQDAALFSGTIRENIAYANPKASLEAIEKAARAANAHDFIMKFSDGYDTEIGERGIKLSGGQKQRIAIARAILKDAPILILDEATSSLDSKSEHEVQQALNRLMKNRTTLIIAHRLSTIAEVDRIVTIKGGKVDEIGSPSELASTGGIYAELLALQLGATEATKKKLAKFDISL